jgi:hypothetical protein
MDVFEAKAIAVGPFGTTPNPDGVTASTAVPVLVSIPWIDFCLTLPRTGTPTPVPLVETRDTPEIVGETPPIPSVIEV